MFMEDSMADHDVAELPATPAQAAPDDVPGRGKSHVEQAPRRRAGKTQGHVCGAPKVDGSGLCPAAVSGPGRRCPFHDTSPEALARMALARQQGGRAPRVGLGVEVKGGIDISTRAGVQRLLAAVAEAAALGRITSAQGQLLVSVAKVALQAIAEDNEAQLAALRAKVDQLVGSRVIPGR